VCDRIAHYVQPSWKIAHKEERQKKKKVVGDRDKDYVLFLLLCVCVVDPLPSNVLLLHGDEFLQVAAVAANESGARADVKA